MFTDAVFSTKPPAENIMLYINCKSDFRNILLTILSDTEDRCIWKVIGLCQVKEDQAKL